MSSSAARIIVAVLLSPALLFAQSGGGKPGSGTGSTGTSTSSGPKNTTSTPTTPSRSIPPLQPDEQRPILLSGRVVMDDGTPPSERVSIERICNGRSLREGYTDSHGYFSITIGQRGPSMIMQDASVGSDSMDPMRPGNGSSFGSGLGAQNGQVSLSGCELRGVLAGTISQTLQLTGHRALDPPDVGTIVLRRVGKVNGSTISVTSLKAPSNARKAFEHGQKALKKKKPDEARQDFLKAVEQYPEYAEAWADLADLYMSAQDVDNAQKASEKAMAADSHFVRPFFTLIVLAASRGDWKASADYSDRLLALDSFNYPAAYYYDALAYYNLHDLPKAQTAVLAARKCDINSKLPKIALLLAAIASARNDYAGAVQGYQDFLKLVSTGPDADYARQELAAAQTHVAAASSVPPK